MPRYKRKHPKWQGFKDPRHMMHWLTKQDPEEERYAKHFREKAKDWLDGRSEPPVRLSKRALRHIVHNHPLHLAGEMMTELKHQRKGGDVGGGITEAIHTLGSEAANLLGIPKIIEWFGGGYTHRKIPREQQIFAEAVQATYKKIEDRPDTLFGLIRLPEYDLDRLSVWKEPNGNSVFVSVHGTTMTWHDIGADAQILTGQTVTSQEVQDTVIMLAEAGFEIDIGAHSLGTQYIVNLPLDVQEHIDDVYLWNPASSPFQDTSYLIEQANHEHYTYFMNPSDVVSNGLWQQMSHDTVDNQTYIGGYRWSPISAHSMDQWSDLDIENEDEIAKYYKGPDPAEVRQTYRAHLMGKARERDIEAAHREEVDEMRGGGILVV